MNDSRHAPQPPASSPQAGDSRGEAAALAPGAAPGRGAAETPEARRSRRRAALGLSIAATFLAILSTGIVNVALPPMMKAFGAEVGAIQWVVTAYMLTFSISLPVAGWASDRYGRAPVFAGALGVFVAGSLLGGMAPDLATLVAARVVQAVGASALSPTAMALLYDHFEPHERGSVLGIWAFGATLGPALGPTLGGFLVDEVGWRSVFFVYVPAGLLVLALAVRFLGLKAARHGSGSFDARGLVALALLFAGVHLVTDGLAHEGPSGQPALGAVLALAGLGGIALGPRAGATPLVDLGLFARRNYRLALALGALRSFALFGSVFLLPLYLQQVCGLNALQTALLMLPAALGLSLSSPLAGRLAGRVDTRILATTGILVVAGSLAMMAWLPAQLPLLRVLASQALRGVGISLLVTPVMAAALNDMPEDRVGSASGLISITMQVGGALGVAVVSGLLARSLGASAGPGRLLGSASAASAFGLAFLLTAAVSLLGLFPAARIRARPSAAPPPPPDPSGE